MISGMDDKGMKDCTPLMESSSVGYSDIVKLLLDHGVEVNAKSAAGNTALTYACCGGHEEVVKILLKKGASIEEPNENGHTPLMEAASSGHIGVAKLLLRFGANINTHSVEFKESALTLACYKGHLDMVRFLLGGGADQEHKTDEMHTALMEVSMDGHVDVARLLLDHGAQVNMLSDSFESPLTLSACGGHHELSALLISRGADLEEVNDEGSTPLMEAAREGHDDVITLLVENDVWSAPAAPVATTRMILQLQPAFLVRKVISHLIMGQQSVCSVEKEPTRHVLVSRLVVSVRVVRQHLVKVVWSVRSVTRGSTRMEQEPSSVNCVRRENIVATQVVVLAGTVLSARRVEWEKCPVKTVLGVPTGTLVTQCVWSVGWGGTSRIRDSPVVVCPQGYYCKYNFEPPQPCPPDAYCPAGSQSPQYCGPLFVANGSKDVCIPMPAFYVVLVLSVTAMLMVLAILAIITVFRVCRSRRPIRSGSTPLLSKSVKTPTYRGL